MALAHNRLIAPLWRRLRTTVGIRFTRFVGVALISLATSVIALTLCNGVFHMTSTPAAIIAWFSGAVVSYVLSRWAWERKGKPDVAAAARDCGDCELTHSVRSASPGSRQRPVPGSSSRHLRSQGNVL